MSKHAPWIKTAHENAAAQGIEVPSGFAAYGFPVPSYRKHAAHANYRDMNPDISTEDATRDIDTLCQFIERDQPYEAEGYWRKEMDGAGYAASPRRALDLTGYYRLLAVLMTAGDPDAAS